MTFDIEINGHGRTISIERATADRYRVVVDGRAQLIDATRVGGFGLSLLFDGADRSSREIQVSPGSGPGEMLVGIDGKSVTVVVNGRRTGHAAAEGGAHARGDQAVVAPMPGRVVRLLVASGDEVSARQPIVVVEAMKMENELRSPKAGRVKEVVVKAGESVEAGRVLAVIE
jgi:acetyl/propionyl-CoA carboxylase alpha subunit